MSLACDCAFSNFLEVYNSSDNIFVGIPTEIKCSNGAKYICNDVPNIKSGDYKNNCRQSQANCFCDKKITINVIKSFKGNAIQFTNKIVNTLSGGGDCGIVKIEKNVPYIFYSHVSRGKEMITICDNTSKIVSYQEEIKALLIGDIQKPEFIKNKASGKALKIGVIDYSFESLIADAMLGHDKYSLYNEYELLNTILNEIVKNDIKQKEYDIVSDFVIDSLVSKCLPQISRRLEIEVSTNCSVLKYKDACINEKKIKLNNLYQAKKIYSKNRMRLNSLYSRYLYLKNNGISMYKGKVLSQSVGSSIDASEYFKQRLKEKVMFYNKSLESMLRNYIVVTNKKLVINSEYHDYVINSKEIKDRIEFNKCMEVINFE